MAVYVPTRHKLWTNLDEMGATNFSMVRFNHESLGDFRTRLLLESREPAGPSQKEFIASVSRQIALPDIPVFKIDLVLDSQGKPIASDPYIEITSTRLRAYNVHADGEISIETNLYDRSNGLILGDIYNAFSGNAYFTIDILDDDYANRLSKYLRFSNSKALRRAYLLLESKENYLPDRYITAIYPDASPFFRTEVQALADINEPGEFYVDYTNGVIFTNDPPLATITYEYRQFPFVVWWSSVHAWPMNDPDRQYIFKETIIDDQTGLESYDLVGDLEAKIVNELLMVHPLTWGE